MKSLRPLKLLIKLLVIVLLRQTTSQHLVGDYYNAVLDSFDANVSIAENIATIFSYLCPNLATNCAVNNGEKTQPLLTDSLNKTRPASEFLLNSLAQYFPGYCVKCSCENTCVINRNCCISKLNQSELLSSFPKQMRSRCMYANMKTYKGNYNMINYQHMHYMVTKCFDDNADNDVVNKCHQPNIEIPDEIVPVTSKNTNITYWNRYCAKCNHDDNIEPWQTQINFNFDLLSLEIFPSSRSEIINLGTSPRHDVIFIRPKLYPVEETCVQDEMLTRATCDQPGKEVNNHIRNEMINQACSHINSTYISYSMSHYRNVFCYLCHLKDFIYTIDLKNETETFLHKVLERQDNQGIFGLLDLRNLEKSADDINLPNTAYQSNNNCTCQEIFDRKQGKCRKVFCPFLEGYLECSCIRLIDDLKGMQVKAFLEVRPLSNEGLQNKWKKPGKILLKKLNTAVSELLQRLEKVDAQVVAVFLSSDHSGYFFYLVLIISPQTDRDNLMTFSLLLQQLEKKFSLTVEGVLFRVSIGPIIHWEIEDNENKPLLAAKRLFSKKNNFAKLDSMNTLSKLLFCNSIRLTSNETEQIFASSNDLSIRGTHKQGNVYFFVAREFVKVCLDDFMDMFHNFSNNANQFRLGWKVFVMACTFLLFA